jgi:hypothetical protein
LFGGFCYHCGMTELKMISDWCADLEFQGQPIESYYENGMDRDTFEMFFPRRPDLDRPGKEIDAALRVDVHPSWPDLNWPVTKKVAEEIVLTMVIIDSIHEALESVRPFILEPHAHEEHEGWTVLRDVSVSAAKTLLAEYPR